MRKLVAWAKDGDEPLRSYSTGLLAAATEIQDMAANYRDTNAVLVRFTLCYINIVFTGPLCPPHLVR